MSDRTRELECVIADLKQQVRDAEKERDALRAKIEATEQQEPVAWAATDETCLIVEALSFNQSRRFDTPLYALPGAQPKDEALWPTIANGMITPDGWKLVPRPPTPTMVKAGLESSHVLNVHRVLACYDAMIDAAPEAKP